MQKRNFVSLVFGSALAGSEGATYLLGDKANEARSDIDLASGGENTLQSDEREILLLASLAPSGHNARPKFVKWIEPYHWIVGNDRSRWLTGVDPAPRETILSLGAFLQNLEYAAYAFGYQCQFSLLAASNQAEQVMDLRLVKADSQDQGNIGSMTLRHTVRGNLLSEPLRKADLARLVADEGALIHYLPAVGKEAHFIKKQIYEANKLQTYREPAQQELADWIKFSSADCRKYRDGLTMGGMAIEGLRGGVLRNFDHKASVMNGNFRKRGTEQARHEVAAGAGWFLITSEDHSVATLLDTGRLMQRLFLKVRTLGTALHPMSQILENSAIRQTLPTGTGLGKNSQFAMRTGYLTSYPPQVSLRRPVSWFVRR